MKHTAVVDLGFGDAGKGALVDRLCAKGDVDLVVRWNGGCQAQHNVVQDDGRHHTFSQFGSGSFHGVPTWLADPVMVEPYSMLIESDALSSHLGYDAMELMHVSPHCLITTPYHWLVNQWQEDQRGADRHGSCGRGIGMTQFYALHFPDDAIQVRDVIHGGRQLTKKLHALVRWALLTTNSEIKESCPGIESLAYDYTEWLNRVKVMDSAAASVYERIVFEGAQGMLLDEDWGFHPHTTWSHVAPDWVREFCGGPFPLDLEVVGVTRAYTTRHGAGPFVAEDNTLNLPESHNKREHFQGAWRVGHFDLPAIQYAARAAQIDSVYVTHVDVAEREPNLKVCTGYRVGEKSYQPLPLVFDDFARRIEQTRILSECTPILKAPTDYWVETIGSALNKPIAGYGYGPKTSDGIFTNQTVIV